MEVHIISKIDEYGIGKIVIEKRQTMSLADTAEYVNKYVLDNGDSITHELIRKWEIKNNITYATKDNNIVVGVPLNTYTEIINLNNKINAHLSTIQGEIDKSQHKFDADGNKVLDVKMIPTELLNAYTTAVNTKHKIALDMVKLEKEMLNTVNTKKIIDSIVDCVKELDKELRDYTLSLSRELKQDIPAYSLWNRWNESLLKHRVGEKISKQ